MEFMYEVCFLVFSTKFLSSYVQTLSLLMYFLVEVIFIGQNTQFFWNPTLSFNNWDTYYDFWNSINFASVDVAAANLGYIPEFLLFEVTLIGLIFSITALVIILKLCGKKPPRLVMWIAKLNYYVVCEVNFIPTCILIFIIFKYSDNPSEYVIEYPNKVSGDIVDFGKTGKVLSIFSILMLILLTIFFEISKFEIWDENPGRIECKNISPAPNLFIKFTYLINSYFFTNIQLTHYGKYLYIAFVNYSLATYLVISSVVYYSTFLNVLKVWSHLNLTAMCLFFILGMEMNDSAVTFVLTILMQPAILFFSYYLIVRRVKAIEPIEKTQAMTFNHFEISIRPHLVSGNLKRNLLTFMQKNLNLNGSKINSVLQAYYCLYTLNDPSLAITKISKVDSSGLDVISNYQVFKCKTIIKDACRLSSYSYKLLIYFKDFDTIKEKDKLFCEKFKDFFEVCQNSNISLRKFKLLIAELVLAIDELKEKYRKIIKSFPEALEVKQYFGSLLLNVLNNAKKGQKLISQASFSSALKSSDKYLQFKGLGLMVVSVDSPPGDVVYYNASLLRFLKMPREAANQMNISKLIPEVYAKTHDSKLTNFAKKALSCTVNSKIHIVILDFEGFLNECLLSIELIGDGDQLFYIVSIEPLEFDDRDYALVSENGLISEHSKNLSYVLKSSRKMLEGSYLSEFLDNFYLAEPEKVYSFKLTGSDIIVHTILKLFNFSSTNIPLVFFTCDLAEAQKWSNPYLFLKQESQSEENFRCDLFSKNEIPSHKHENKSFTQSSNSNVLRFSSSMNSSLRSFTLIKIFLLASILIIFAFSLTITSMTIEEVNHKIDSGSLKNLNNILYSFSNVALLSYSLDLKSQGIIDLDHTESDLLSELGRLKSLRNSYIINKEEWINCETISVSKKPELVYWNIEDAAHLSDKNIEGSINRILTNGEQYHDCQSQIGCKKLLSEILSVSIGIPYKKLLLASQGLASCEQERIDKLKAKVFIVSLSGFGVFFLAISFTFMYLKCIESFLQDLWKTLGFNLRTRSKHFRKMISERLLEVHQVKESGKQDGDAVDEKEFKINEQKHYLKYIARFIFLFLLSLSLYFANTLYFCDAIYKLLTFQPQLLELTLDDRNNFSLLNFIILDQHLNKANLSTVRLNDFINYEKEQKNVVNRIYKNTENIKNFKMPELILPEFSVIMNDKIENTSHFLELGVFKGINYLLQESDFLLSQQIFKSDEVKKFSKNCEKIVSLLSTEFDSIQSYTDSVILQGLRNQLLFFILTFLLLFAIYYYFYYKYLDNEVKVIYNIIAFINLVPPINHHNADNPN